MATPILTQKDVDRFFSKTKRNEATGCLEWTGYILRPWGYGHIRIGGRRGKMFIASRIAWLLANGPIPEGLCVLHHCDNPSCVEVGPGHLFLGSQADNATDREAKGRGNPPSADRVRHALRARGERNGSARLTSDEVAKIREAAAAGSPQRHIAAIFGIGKSTVAHIIHNRTWNAPTQERTH